MFLRNLIRKNSKSCKSFKIYGGTFRKSQKLHQRIGRFSFQPAFFLVKNIIIGQVYRYYFYVIWGIELYLIWRKDPGHISAYISDYGLYFTFYFIDHLLIKTSKTHHYTLNPVSFSSRCNSKSICCRIFIQIQICCHERSCPCCMEISFSRTLDPDIISSHIGSVQIA